VVDRIAQSVITGQLHDGGHILVDLDAEGEYVLRIEDGMALGDLNLDDLANYDGGLSSHL